MYVCDLIYYTPDHEIYKKYSKSNIYHTSSCKYVSETLFYVKIYIM